MRGQARVIGLVMLFHCVTADAQQAGQLPNPPGTIRVSVDRINVGVTVTDSRGRSIPGLQREDFRIFDDGTEQPISGFVPSEEPARLVFLIEAGTPDYLLVKLGKSPLLGANNLLSSISAFDNVAIVTFSKEPRLALDFTQDKQQAKEVLQDINSQFMSLRANASSGWLNLSSSLAATIDWLAPAAGSKIIVVLSTGVDTSPPEGFRAVQEKLKTCDVRILALSMFGDFRKPVKHKKLSDDDRATQMSLKQGMAQSDALLSELSGASGGHAYFPKSAKDFDRAYDEIAQLVRSEYTLEFVPPAYDNRIHSIGVKMKHSRYHADYRLAYLAPASPAN